VNILDRKAEKPMFSLRFNKQEIPYWAGRYPVEDDRIVDSVIAPSVRKQGYFSKSNLKLLCSWKTPRSKPLIESNPENFIHAVTQTALSTPDERLRIEVLMLLAGVKWPTASVLLHFGHSDPYPIMDYRALWSLGVDASQMDYDFEFWRTYTQFCRKLADKAGVSMRILDRALWQYCKEKPKETI
jgi:hypothetical protein